MSLLEKNLPLIVDKENPFKDDCLDRKTLIMNLTTLIRSLTQPFVISIEAPWGSGKTTFVQMWQQYLKNDNQPCLYFNAWENDFAVDPLIAFLGEMSKLLDQEKTRGRDQAIQKSLDRVIKVGGKLIKRSLPVAIRIASQGIITEDVIRNLPAGLSESSDEIAVFLGDVTKDSIQAFIDNKKSVQSFKQELEKFSQLVVKDGKKSPIVIFIDELDRCRPSYGIELLERVKHLFNIPGVVFILSLDRQQLENSVSATYGINIDSNGYLARFIDYRFRLPNINDGNFPDYLFTKNHFTELFQKRSQINKQSYEYDDLIHFTKTFVSVYNLSLRSQERCFTELNLIIRLIPPNRKIYPYILPFLVILKSLFPVEYEQLVTRKITFEDLLGTIPESFQKVNFIKARECGLVEGPICHYLQDEKVLTQKVETYKAYINNPDHDINQAISKERANGFLQILESERYLYNTSPVGMLVRMLSIIDEISIDLANLSKQST